MNLFTIDGLSFNKEDFLDNIIEYEDIIAIIEELQEILKYYENRDMENVNQEIYELRKFRESF